MLPGEIMGKSLCGSVPAEKLGHVKISCWTSFYTVENFNCPRNIDPISTDHVQLLCSPCNSASDLISVLQLFTRVEDQHCTCFVFKPSVQVAGADPIIATPPWGKIHPFTKIDITFEPLMRMGVTAPKIYLYKGWVAEWVIDDNVCKAAPNFARVCWQSKNTTFTNARWHPSLEQVWISNHKNKQLSQHSHKYHGTLVWQRQTYQNAHWKKT